MSESSLIGSDAHKRQQFEAIKRWFYNDWCAIDPKLRTSIVEGISVFLSLFDTNPKVKQTFCPPKQCYDPWENQDYRYGRPLPGFAWLIEQGKVCALNVPVSLNAGLARALGTFLKMDFQRAVLNRIPVMAAHPERHFRQTFFICDEYHLFATTGESDPSGDEKAFSLSLSSSPSSPPKASPVSRARCRVRPGGRCSRLSAPRSFWPSPTTSVPSLRASSVPRRTSSRSITT